MALSATRVASRRVSHLRSSRLPAYRQHAFSTSHPVRRPDAFHSMVEEARKASDVLSANPNTISSSPQTRTEKIIQKHSVGLAPGKVVKSGDYVSLRPQHSMSHDNSFPILQNYSTSERPRFTTLARLSLPLITQCRTRARPISRNMPL